MEEQVHLGDGGGGEVHLLPVEPQGAGGAPMGADAIDRLDQHAAGPAGRVVDRLTRLGVEHPHDQPDDLARREELARLLAALIREVLEQVLVGLAEHVVVDLLRVQGQPVEGVDQGDQGRLGQALFVAPRRVTEDSREAVRVGLLRPSAVAILDPTLSVLVVTSRQWLPLGRLNLW